MEAIGSYGSYGSMISDPSLSVAKLNKEAPDPKNGCLEYEASSLTEPL